MNFREEVQKIGETTHFPHISAFFPLSFETFPRYNQKKYLRHNKRQNLKITKRPFGQYMQRYHAFFTILPIGAIFRLLYKVYLFLSFLRGLSRDNLKEKIR